MSGYIGNIPTPQATQTRDTFTATAGQTTFATSGYTPSFLDVFLNGVHLVNGTDYTASNGSDVVLTSGAAAGDTLEVVAYSTYQVNSQNYTGGLTVDNDGATVLTVDRASSNGTIIDLQKDNTTVGNWQSRSSLVSSLVLDPRENGGGITATTGAFYVVDETGQSGSDNTHDLGVPTVRFRNLYLSGGVYLGGTGAANYLDDYEEGTWTLTNAGDATGTITSSTNRYTKIGRTVVVHGTAQVTANFSNIKMGGLPFNPDQDASISSIHGGGVCIGGGAVFATVNDGSGFIEFRDNTGSGTAPTTGIVRFTIVYQTS